MEVGMIVNHRCKKHRCKRVTREEDSDLIWAGQRLHFETMGIQLTTEYMTGYTPVVGTSASALG